jgi:hypothetical protein
MSMSSVFSNGTEGYAWMDVWCNHCAHDHAMHNDGNGPGCGVVIHMMTSDEWPEAIMPEPPGEFHLPPLHLCGMFTPCTSCGGDPLADVRSNVIAHTTQAWADHKATR